jgi:uncharacterized protein YcsI (UPF0317 family)
VQANLAILPADWASEFLLFCQKNPKPCPVLAVTNPGDPIFPTLGNDVDVRTDAPRYKVFRDGVIVDKPTDLRDIWRDDLVAFAIGCSFSFEEALIETGLRIRHLEQGLNVPMYISSIDTNPTPRFLGKMPEQAVLARRFPPPWSVIEHPESFAITDAMDPVLSYVYFEDNPGRR